MLFVSKIPAHRSLGIAFSICCAIITLWSLLPGTSWLNDYSAILSTITWNDGNTSLVPQVLPLPPAYAPTPPFSARCAELYGTEFIRNATRMPVNYCSDASLSRLTCFRTHAFVPERVDSFCISTPASFNDAERKFELDCMVRDLTEQEASDSIPALDQFPGYWYGTGPRIILEENVILDAAEMVRSEDTSLPRNYTILVKREGEKTTDNLFHHGMQLFSIFLTLDVLQTTLDPATGEPFFRAGDVENTRVVILDDHPEGHLYDQWAASGKRGVVRIDELGSDPLAASENLILPLPGHANPMWQDDYEPQDCRESKLLQVFSQRMLNFYEIEHELEPPDRPLILTFIDRRQKRKLIDKEAYIDSLSYLYPHIEIALVDFASLSFVEQLRIVRNTDILVGVHGAGLTHGMYLPPSSAMVEIMPHGFHHKGFRNLAKRLGHQYFTTHATLQESHTRSKGWQFDDVFIEQDRFNDLIDAAIKSMYHRGLRGDDVN